MNPFELLFLIMGIFAVIGIILTIIVPVFWFLIVPSVARRITWNRFRDIIYIMVSDDAGRSYLLNSKKTLPEGVIKDNEGGWRFLSRPVWNLIKIIKKTRNQGEPKPQGEEPSNPTETETTEADKTEPDEIEAVYHTALRKTTWADVGKPIAFAHAGKVELFNPSILASLAHSKDTVAMPTAIAKLRTFAKEKLPPNLTEDFTAIVKELALAFKSVPLTYFDPTVIKEVAPKMYTPSQLDALATESEYLGMKRAGTQYTKLFLGFGVLMMIALCIIVALTQL